MVAVAVGLLGFQACSEDNVAAEEKAPERDGRISVEKRTIGVTSIVLTAGSSKRLLKGIQDAASLLGWEVIECDAAGDAAASDTCITSLIQQGADAVLSMGSEPALLRQALKRASDKGVPVVNIGGTVSDPDAFDASYAPDDVQLSTVLNDKVFEDLGDASATIGAYVNDAIVAIRTRTEALREQVAERSDVELEEMSTANYTDPFASSRQAAQSLLRANDDVRALWGSGTTNVPGAVAAVEDLGAEQDVKVYGFYLDDALAELLRQGKVAAVADTTLEVNSYTAIDQLLALWEGEGAIDPEAEPVPVEYVLYTPDNLDEVSTDTGQLDEFQSAWAEDYS
ncbi:sugar ABC transporter substrate-binding protein [Nocardioides sp. TF02-7]|uniref:sugar ABC transporter substrate-binding protein n=1 Tax=Nocardioides sp. TF02-7 TaxID=2917724 RepID=UPI001F06D006|nr:sugar ABC transporter substrate-binding protein [Nocardioides sp. TF02-7]UMG91190.1 sugar ABC transporter substrate-binding protein [Nocardioides sp. TF02-7]